MFPARSLGMKRIRLEKIVRVVAVAVLAGSASLCAGCYADVQAEPVSVYGYEPRYYDGYVVYYDDGGRPFYYVNGRVSWVTGRVAALCGLRQSLADVWTRLRPLERRGGSSVPRLSRSTLVVRAHGRSGPLS